MGVFMNYFLSIMPRIGRLYIKTLLIFLLAFGFSCTLNGPEQTSQSGGTGSEIIGTAAYDSSGMGKSIAVKLVNAATMIPVISGNVFCYQRSAVPDTNWVRSGDSPRVRTDSDGGFVIEDAPPGEVVVEANDGKGNSSVTTVNIDRDSTKYPIGVIAVKKTGAITIKALTQLPGRVRFYVGVKGTRLVARGSQTGIDITLDNIPCDIVHTISIRVYEPISFSLDISNVSVSSTVTKALGSFQIK
jgi:hypothetical protein